MKRYTLTGVRGFLRYILSFNLFYKFCLLSIAVFSLPGTGCIQKPLLQNTNNRVDASEALDSISFQNPVLNFCVRSDGIILALDAGQEKIFRINLNKTAVIETIILPQKIYFLKGIASDNIFIYLFSENSLYRYDKTTQKLITLIEPKHKIRIYDLTITTEGEIFVSDDMNNQIYLINNLNRINKFNTSVKDLFIPAGISYDNKTAKIWLINRAQSRIEVYSRIGNLDSIIILPNNNLTKILAGNNQVFVWGNEKNIYNITGNKIIRYLSFGNRITTNAWVYKNLFLVLVNSRKILMFKQ